MQACCGIVNTEGNRCFQKLAYFASNTLASSQTITGKFLRSLNVGRITEYLWVSEDENCPCILRAGWLSNGFICDTCDIFHSMPLTVQSFAIRKLIGLLRQILRITIDDGRVYLGTFAGTDKLLNILLLNAEEYRIGQDGIAGRFVGQVLVPWRLVLNVESPSHTGLDLYI